MKTSGKAVLMAMAAALGLAAGTAPACAHAPDGGWGGEHEGRHGGHFLDLSKAQKKQMQAAFQSEKPVMTPLRRALRDAVVKLKDQVEDKASDADLQASMDNVAKAQAALQGEKKAFRARLDAILTPSQRARALLFRIKRMRRMHEGRMAWRGGGCPMMRRGGRGWGGKHFGSDDGREAGAGPEEAGDSSPQGK